MTAVRLSARSAPRLAAIVLAFMGTACTFLNNGVTGDPEKLSQLVLSKTQVNAAGRDPAVVEADVRECEQIARAMSPIGVEGAAMMGQGFAQGAVVGAANGAANQAGTSHAGVLIGVNAVGEGSKGAVDAAHSAQKIVLIQAYQQAVDKAACLLKKNYGNAVMADPGLLAAARNVLSGTPDPMLQSLRQTAPNQLFH